MVQKTRTLPVIILILGCFLLLMEVARMLAVVQVKKTLNVQIERLKERGINLSYDNVQIGMFNRSILISRLYAYGMNGKDSVFTTSFKEVNLIHIDLKKLVFLKEFDIGHLNIEGIDLMTKSKHSLKQFEPKEDVKSKTKKLQIGNIKLSEISWSNYDAEDSLAMVTTTETLEIGGFRIDSLKNKLLKYEFRDLSSDKITFQMAKGKHIATIQKAKYDEIEGDLVLDSINIIPLYSRAVFPTYFDHQVDRITAHSKSIRFYDLTFWDLNKLYIRSKKMEMDFYIEVYRDKIRPFKKSTVAQLPAEMLKDIRFLFSIDTVKVHKSFVAYEEMINTSRGTGRIFFNNMSIDAQNFTNDSSKISNTLLVKGDFMDKGNMVVNFVFPFDTAVNYSAKGHMSPFQLTEINSILKSAVLIEVKTGKLDTLNFEFDYDEQIALGKVEFAFTGLKMTAFKPKNPDKVALLKTIALNQVLKINDVNKASLIGRIRWERIPVKSIFSYWWKSLLSGLKAAIIEDGYIKPQRKKERERALADF